MSGPDIVERLRRTSEFIASATGKENSRWVHEAADEIERLRAELQLHRDELVKRHKFAR